MTKQTGLEDTRLAVNIRFRVSNRIRVHLYLSVSNVPATTAKTVVGCIEKQNGLKLQDEFDKYQTDFERTNAAEDLEWEKNGGSKEPPNLQADREVFDLDNLAVQS